MFMVDTNILVHSADQRSPEHARANHLVREWREGPERWFTTWSVLYEFLRVVTHRRFRDPLTFEQA